MCCMRCRLSEAACTCSRGCRLQVRHQQRRLHVRPCQHRRQGLAQAGGRAQVDRSSRGVQAADMCVCRQMPRQLLHDQEGWPLPPKGVYKVNRVQKGDITKVIQQNPAAASHAAQAEVSTPFPPALQRQLLLADQHAVQVSIHPVAGPDLDAANHNPHLCGRVEWHGCAGEMRQPGEHGYAKSALQAHD